MTNVSQIISGMNRRKLGDCQSPPNLTCSCRNDPCPLDGKCNVSDIVYEASLTDNQGEEYNYIGITSEPFRNRFAKHKLSFNNSNYGNQTTLSSKYWELKNKGRDPEIKFNIVGTSKSYGPGVKKM